MGSTRPNLIHMGSVEPLWLVGLGQKISSTQTMHTPSWVDDKITWTSYKHVESYNPNTTEFTIKSVSQILLLYNKEGNDAVAKATLEGVLK